IQDGDGEAGRLQVTLFTPVASEPLMVADKRQAYLGPLTEYTVYSDELIGLNLALEIMENRPENRPVAIFTDNHAAIKAIRCPKSAVRQYKQ
ncbi:hypothetical protein MMC29_005670, partial [Sticta canariensis]|nr:hypothetical protein [Sticta canariensis]